jgi:DNA-binding transcriptional ArsR family regulator
MGASKKEFVPEKQNTSATLCKAFGHPARVIIIEHLLFVNECIAEDFLEIIPLSRATIWQHLQELEDARLIIGNFKENTFRYKINSLKIENVKSYFLGISGKAKNPMFMQ